MTYQNGVAHSRMGGIADVGTATCDKAGEVVVIFALPVLLEILPCNLRPCLCYREEKPPGRIDNASRYAAADTVSPVL